MEQKLEKIANLPFLKSHNFIGFSVLLCLTQFSRWMLGSFRTIGYEMLSGKLIDSNFSRVFWPRYAIAISCLISICCVLILWKKYNSQNQVIQINLDQNEDDENLNNQLHNKPILNFREVAFGIGTVMLICVLFVLPNLNEGKGNYSPHYQMLCTEIVGEIFMAIFLPIYIMMKKEAMRNFLLNEIQNYMNIDVE